MENPDAYRAGKELVEFEWRQNHRNFYSSFSLKFYQENDMPLLTGWFPSQSGGDEIRESQDGCIFQPGSLAAHVGTVVCASECAGRVGSSGVQKTVF